MKGECPEAHDKDGFMGCFFKGVADDECNDGERGEYAVGECMVGEECVIGYEKGGEVNAEDGVRDDAECEAGS